MNEESTPTARVVQALDDAELRRWLVRSADALRRHRHRLDALNVYPVPDGDTGTNLHLTLDGALQGLVRSLVGRGQEGEHTGPGISAGFTTLARQCLFEARGNSGVILSQFVAGFAAATAAASNVDETGIDATVFTEALEEADRRARAAVAEPVEGTMLTVMRAAARASREALARGAATVTEAVEAAAAAARRALADTPQHLPALRRAGVVDAGGAGLVVVLDALADVVRGRGESGAEPGESPEARSAPEPSPRPESPQYEAMYLVDDLSDAAAQALIRRLSDIGDSVVVAGDSHVRTVHVHTAMPGAAVEAVLDLGRPYGIRIALLEHAHGSEEAGPASDDRPSPPTTAPTEEGFGAVACVEAPALVEAFEQAGLRVVRDSPGQRPSPSALVEAVRATGHRRVVVLPDDADIVLSARLAAEVAAESGIEVDVIPTVHLVQGWAAVAVMDAADARSIVSMREAAEAVRHGLVATATSDSHTAAGPCRAGDVLGFVGAEVEHVGTSVAQVGAEVVRSLLAEGGELVTVIEGEAAYGAGAEVAALLGEAAGVEVDVRYGGQSVYELLVGVE